MSSLAAWLVTEEIIRMLAIRPADKFFIIAEVFMWETLYDLIAEASLFLDLWIIVHFLRHSGGWVRPLGVSGYQTLRV